jgi:TPR repeat protein
MMKEDSEGDTNKVFGRTPEINRLIELYDSFKMKEFMNQSIGCEDINIRAMRFLCEYYGRTGTKYGASPLFGGSELDVLEKMANGNDCVAQTSAAVISHIFKDELDGKAVAWLVSAANQGYRRAMTKLGTYLLLDGKELDKGKVLLESAINQGCVGAMCNYGIYLLRTAKTEIEVKTAKDMLLRGAEGGVVEAYKVLCKSTKVDSQEIRYYIRHAWERGHDISGSVSRKIFSFGCPWNRKRFSQFRLPRMTMEELNRLARHDLVANTYRAYAYLDGRLGLPQDCKKAKRLFMQIAKKGGAVAQKMLGECYHKGIGGRVDFKKALYWYNEAAKQNECDGFGYLGYMHAEGQGCKQDMRCAFEYWRRAAELGDEGSQYNLALCYLGEVNVVEIDCKKAIDLLWPLACHGRHSAIEKLGICYVEGIGVEKDEDRGYGLLAVAKNFKYVGVYEDCVKARQCLGYLEFYKVAVSAQNEYIVDSSVFRMVEDYEYKYADAKSIE